MKRDVPPQPPRQTVHRRIQFAMWIAIGLPLVVTCAVHTGLVVNRESKAASGALLDRSRAGAMALQTFTESHSYSDFADFAGALQGENRAAFDVTKRWSASLMNRSDMIGVALLDAHGDVLFKWPAELAIDFAAPGVVEGSVPSVYRWDASASGPLDPTASGVALLDVDVSIAIAAVERGPELAPLAYVSIATVSPNVWARTARQVIPLVVLLALGALVTGALIQRSIQTYVSAPLAVIARQMQTPHPDGGIGFDENAAVELAQIARSFGELQDELQESRRQSVVLERRVESTAAEETRKIQQLLARARKDAEHDSLTGLTNRRFIEERLEPIFQEQISQRVNVVIAMFDVDNFKRLNDTEGHVAGDEILRFFGELLRGTLREDDVGVRYGGDEFAAILMDISEQQAHDVCDRIVKLFNRQIGAMNIKTKVTLSSGFASRFATEARSATELLSQADAALYKAKRSGKGCVVGFEVDLSTTDRSIATN